MVVLLPADDLKEVFQGAVLLGRGAAGSVKFDQGVVRLNDLDQVRLALVFQEGFEWQVEVEQAALDLGEDARIREIRFPNDLARELV